MSQECYDMKSATLVDATAQARLFRLITPIYPGSLMSPTAMERVSYRRSALSVALHLLHIMTSRIKYVNLGRSGLKVSFIALRDESRRSSFFRYHRSSSDACRTGSRDPRTIGHGF
jgi:hypothetical protein